MVAGCQVHLRSYNGKVTGDTLRIKPGDTLYLRLVNNLPANAPSVPHPQQPPPSGHAQQFNFNITNLHTHGLHVSPEGISDNVLLEVGPQTTQPYAIRVPEDHPPGTFWYHAHLHGSTAVQVSSGMAGALIVEGGLDELPEIKAAKEKIFVLQQLVFDQHGRLESFDPFNDLLGAEGWQRHVTVNGQLVPTITMRPGEVQRWRMIHAGVKENIVLILDDHKLHEVAVDGIALGRAVSWPASAPLSNGSRGLFLAPGYRSDVLVQANPLRPGETRREYLLRDEQLSPRRSLQAAGNAVRLALTGATSPRVMLGRLSGKPDGIIARVVVEGDPVDMRLPTDDQLITTFPVDPELSLPIEDQELTGQAQRVNLAAGSFACEAGSGICLPCEDGENCVFRFIIENDQEKRIYMPEQRPRHLKLGQASEWILSGTIFPHPFHIHVNPFEVEREEPSTDGAIVRRKIWKDTLLLIGSDPAEPETITVRARYADFAGKFVLHCHILGHEDMGMMELVEIVR
jgi:FtsP/CotA-like multicopper oxidase with cupredoxin domain